MFDKKSALKLQLTKLSNREREREKCRKKFAISSAVDLTAVLHANFAGQDMSECL